MFLEVWCILSEILPVPGLVVWFASVGLHTEFGCNWPSGATGSHIMQGKYVQSCIKDKFTYFLSSKLLFNLTLHSCVSHCFIWNPPKPTALCSFPGRCNSTTLCIYSGLWENNQLIILAANQALCTDNSKKMSFQQTQ